MLCDDCQKEHDNWMQPQRLNHHTNLLNAPGQPTTRALKDAQTARFNDWRKTVKHQTQLIRNHCQENHQ